MPKYSGDQIYQGGIENGRVTATALNYRRTAASSNFGTRKLAFYSLHIEQDFGLAANWQDSNSLYYQMVRAIQQGGVAVGGIDAPTEGNGDIRGGGGGGAELFYVGEPQNSAASPLNQASGWYNFKPQNDSGHIYVARATGDGTIAKLEFVEQPTPPFNVGDPVRVADVGNGYNCNLYDQHFVTECTTTYVKFNSTATTTVYDGGTSIGYVYVDLGYDCFTFAVADDAEPFLPEGNGFFGDVDFSGVAGDSLCYCGGGRFQSCNYPYNFVQAVAKVLTDNELSTSSLNIWRLKPSFGLTF
jgi:hypothetical protein